MKMKPKVLVIDDYQALLDISKEVLESHGYDVRAALDGLSGVALFKSGYLSISCVITDIDLPDISGFQVIKKLEIIDKTVPILVWSGDVTKLNELKAEGYATLSKPFRLKTFIELVDSIKRETNL